MLTVYWSQNRRIVMDRLNEPDPSKIDWRKVTAEDYVAHIEEFMDPGGTDPYWQRLIMILKAAQKQEVTSENTNPLAGKLCL
jgi:hypothetical protein